MSNVLRRFFAQISNMVSPKDKDSEAESSILPGKWTEEIERITKHKLSIETALTNDNVARCNPQWQSPLFQLPKEIRDIIFEFASTQSPDPKHKYHKASFYYRPDHTARLRSYTNLLLTCRLAWIEANAQPLLQAEHAFWFQRSPYDLQNDREGWVANIHRERRRYEHFLGSLTKLNLQNLSHIHLFLQMVHAEQLTHRTRMEQFFPLDQLTRGMRLKTFQITIRHTDWWDWESGTAPRSEENWVQAVLGAPQMGIAQKFVLELEVFERNAADLDAIVARLERLEGRPKLTNPMDPACPTVCRFVLKEEPKKMAWTRTPWIRDTDGSKYADVPTAVTATTLTWHNEPVPMEGQKAWQLAAPLTVERNVSLPQPPGGLFSVSRAYGRSPRLWARLHWFQWENWTPAETDSRVQHESHIKACAVEDHRRDAFEKMMGDFEAKKLLRLWEGSGSLLKFSDIEL